MAWMGKWISMPGFHRTYVSDRNDPAPYFRREFNGGKFNNVTLKICGLGYFELYLNGQRVGDQVLAPVVSEYDKHSRYLTFDVTSRLRDECNTIVVILGNGWYNPSTAEVWNFLTAPWRDCPKFALELEADGKLLLESDENWRVTSGPIRFDALRNGEFYDARMELTGFTESGYDDSSWQYACRVSGPGGILVEQKQEPCRVLATIPAKFTGRHDLWDVGQNLTGWARITVEGDAGAEVTLQYAERITDDGDLDTTFQDEYILSGAFQTDKYILKGGGVEIWEPRFTYHGFQYIKATVLGNATLRNVEARFVASDFPSVGTLTTSDETINALQKMTRWSFHSNFVGIPTDCPHREKNGWTGDAHIAVETGLWNFDPSRCYREWLTILTDCQRPSGALPGIAPSGGWGFNWGNGPAWDSALVAIPYYIYLYTGNMDAIRDNYEPIKRYLDFCGSMATDYTVSFGLGDWCPSGAETPAAITSTGYYYMDAKMAAAFAELLGHPDEAENYRALAGEIAAAFHRRFYQGNGVYESDTLTALSCALYHDLVPETEKAQVLARLIDKVEALDGAVDFGILGAKYVPRVLADNGRADLALKFFTRRQFPSWGYWVELGLTTLAEHWDGTASRNHIMFGDISAWFFTYLAGFRHDWNRAGSKYLEIAPCPVLESCRAEYRNYLSEWHCADDGTFRIELTIPPNCEALLRMPDGSAPQLLTEGRYQRRCSVAPQK